MNKKTIFMNKKILLIFSIVAIGLLLFTAVAVHAEDDNERSDRSYEREDSVAFESDSGGYEIEDDDYEIEDDDWDMTDDFIYEPVIASDPVVVQEQVVVEEPLVVDQLLESVPVVPESAIVLVDNVSANSNATLANITINLADYNDDDNDTILNKYDLYPGVDDLMFIDSDNDTIPDRLDLYPGIDDRDFIDSDHDGIVDSQDSNSTKNTDKDHDGTDDSVDPQDNRPFFVKFFSMFGLV